VGGGYFRENRVKHITKHLRCQACDSFVPSHLRRHCQSALNLVYCRAIDSTAILRTIRCPADDPRPIATIATSTLAIAPRFSQFFFEGSRYRAIGRSLRASAWAARLRSFFCPHLMLCSPGCCTRHSQPSCAAFSSDISPTTWCQRRLCCSTRCRILLRSLFEATTLAELAELVERARSSRGESRVPAIARRSREQHRRIVAVQKVLTLPEALKKDVTSEEGSRR